MAAPPSPPLSFCPAYGLYALLGPPALALYGGWYALRYLRRGGAMPHFGQRLGWLPAELRALGAQRPIWVHAVSVGEAKTAAPLIEALGRECPGRPIVVSTVTPTGQGVAAGLPGVAATFYLPFDLVPCVRAVLRAVRPSLLVVMETELWPALLRESARAGVPTAVANGRISNKTFPRYRLARPLVRPLLAGLQMIAARSGQDAERFIACGAPPGIVRELGNLKYDALPPPPDEATRARLRQAWRLTPDDLVLVAGSTFPGEETLLLEAWRRAAPHGRLILAPRHLYRVEAVERLVGTHGARRSRLPLLPDGSHPRVLILDRMGELAETYAVADIAFVGKSLFEGGGQNPLEPAQAGVPLLFGPGMSNFAEDAPYLVQQGGAREVTRETLVETLAELAGSPQKRHDMGRAARAAIAARQGAANRIAQALAKLV